MCHEQMKGMSRLVSGRKLSTGSDVFSFASNLLDDLIHIVIRQRWHRVDRLCNEESFPSDEPNV